MSSPGSLDPRTWVRLDRCGSTNDEARKLLDGGASSAVVIADAQDAGRGRRGRSWHSPPGRNLYMSVVLRPEMPTDRAPLLTLALAVAAHDAVRATGVSARIKWPNDLIVRDGTHGPARKLSGMISEAVATPSGVGVICGIGVNVNMVAEELPAEIGAIATSLRMATGADHGRDALARGILEAFFPLAERVESAGAEGVLPAYTARLDTLGRDVAVDTGSEVVKGRAVGLGPMGELLVLKDEGDVVTITAGDVGL